MAEMRTINIAYIGGGSKEWARVFMADLALTEGLSGEIRLYDIDREAAERNRAIGERIGRDPLARSIFQYRVCPHIEEALTGASFVIISILPGTFREMRSDVHAPERYGIYQSVGDTAGPGGVLRAMRTVPIYEGFARKIRECCPTAWVLNLTNPMSACVKALYDEFPGIRAFGCCHEVFHAQEFLTCVLKETRGIAVRRDQIHTDASGVNHFTWITQAKYRDIDLLALLPEFMDRFYDEGYCEQEGKDRFAFRTDPFAYGNKVKMDLFRRYGVLAAAGDRHLAEFLPKDWYLKDPAAVRQWLFHLTTVDFREERQAQRVAESIDLAEGRKPFLLRRSQEEVVEILKALMGFETLVTNVNLPNRGQMPQLPLGSIVETNCVFAHDQAHPVLAGELPSPVCALVHRCCLNVDTLCQGVRERDLDKVFASFLNQALCGSLDLREARALFREMCLNTGAYLSPWFDLEGYFRGE